MTFNLKRLVNIGSEIVPSQNKNPDECSSSGQEAKEKTFSSNGELTFSAEEFHDSLRNPLRRFE